MKVLVTGATGFLGSHITRQLCAEGHRVRILRRASSPTLLLQGLNIETLVGDVTDQDSVLRAVDSCEVVFHVAGLVSFWRGDRQRLQDVNVRGTHNVVTASLTHQVKRLIHTSSVAAIGFAEDGRVGDETLDYNWGPLRIPYCDSKQAAEQEVRHGIQKGLDAVILNPAVVFGAGDLNLHGGAMVLQLARRNIPFWFDGGCTTCDVEDVATAHLAALHKGRTGERYILGGQHFTWRNLFNLIAEVTKVPAPRCRISTWPLLGMAYASDLMGRVTRRHPAFTPEAIRISTVPAYYSSDKAVHELAYTAKPLAESIQKTYHWYNDRGFLAR